MRSNRKSSDSQERTEFLRGVPLPEFLSRAVRTPKGALMPEMHNVALFLEGCPELPAEFAFAFDQMSQGVVGGPDQKPLSDIDVLDCQRWLTEQGLRRLSEHTVRSAILHVADKNPFNPLQEWLASLEWDGFPRIHKWLHWFLGTPDDKYREVVGSMFLRQMVARAMMPGCKADYMLVLEGEQRKMKSTVCEVLAGGDIFGPRYFSDNLPDIAGDHVRIAMHLRGKWVIEISEMHAFNRAEQSRLKQWLSSRVEKYTPKYGRCEVEEPRTIVPIGTTNKKNYLRDETGGSRYWPITCGNIRIKELKQWYPQLMAEAFRQVMTEKRDWWPTPHDEENLIQPHQEARYEGDAWETLIADWDFMVPRCDPNGRPLIGDDAGRDLVYPPYFVKDVAFGALGKPPGQFSKADEMRLAKSLDFMGWSRGNRTNRGTPWTPPKPV